MTASITSWCQKVGAITATWLWCHGCHFITVWWNCLIVGDLLQQWLILMFIIRVSLYFIKSKSYAYSLNMYWTALVFNCFDAMGRNINKQSQFCGPHVFNKLLFSVIFLHAWITIFCSFSFSRELVKLLQYG